MSLPVQLTSCDDGDDGDDGKGNEQNGGLCIRLDYFATHANYTEQTFVTTLSLFCLGYCTMHTQCSHLCREPENSPRGFRKRHDWTYATLPNLDFQDATTVLNANLKIQRTADPTFGR